MLTMMAGHTIPRIADDTEQTDALLPAS